MRNISEMSDMTTYGNFRTLMRTLKSGCRQFGVGMISEFKDFPPYLAAQSQTILTGVVLSSLKTVKKGK